MLRTWREDVTRRSEDVVAIWEEILCDAQGDLSDERWMILEQVAVICTSLRYPTLLSFDFFSNISVFIHFGYNYTCKAAKKLSVHSLGSHFKTLT